jgi:hypothetical protein
MVPGSGVVVISRHSPVEVFPSALALAIGSLLGRYYYDMMKINLTRSVAVRHAVPVARL